MHIVLRTFSEQQRLQTPGPYTFQRPALRATETLMLEGYGAPTRPNGMLHSMFRPSDDACTYPLSVPENLFAVITLRQLAAMSEAIHHDAAFASQCRSLAHEIAQATQQLGLMHDADTPLLGLRSGWLWQPIIYG